MLYNDRIRRGIVLKFKNIYPDFMKLMILLYYNDKNY